MNFRQAFQSLDLPKLSRWGAMIGAVSLLIALIIFLAQEKLTNEAFAALVIGVIGLGAWMLIAPDELRGWLSGRQIYYGTGTVVVTVIFVGLVSAGYAVVQRQQITGDLTTYQKFTLDNVSIDAVNRLIERMNQVEQSGTEADGSPLKITAKIVGFYPRSQLREREAADIILRQFVNAGKGKIKVEYIDPDENPLQASRYGYGLDSASGSTIGPLFLTLVDENDDTRGFQPLVIGEPNERNISTQIVQLLVAGQFKVYFITGHIEDEITSEASLGLSKAATGLTDGLGIDVAELDLSQVDAIPDDASAIMIIAPQTDYSESDIAKIDAYIQQGGRMLIAADPPYVDSRLTSGGNNQSFLKDGLFNQYLWHEFGVRFREDIVSDPLSSTEDSDLNLVVQQFSSHAAVANFPNTSPIFSLVRSIELLEDTSAGVPEPDTNQGKYVRSPLLGSSEESFAEFGLPDADGNYSLTLINLDNPTDFTEGVDIRGPLTIAAAIQLPLEDQQTVTPRIVLVGDADWMTNQLVSQAANSYLLQSLVDWLIGSADLVTPPAASRPDLLPVTVSNQERSRIQLITLILLPGLVLGAGVVMWGTRRRN
ncbi:MAG: GldG family protein [Chloroflexi bacterium]|nr:GldG family protein [Chloroflexota bacterium]